MGGTTLSKFSAQNLPVENSGPGHNGVGLGVEQAEEGH